MQPHDFMYALYIVSLHIHNNRHAQNFFFFHIWAHIDPILFYSPELILTGITLIHKLHKSLISSPKLIFACYLIWMNHVNHLGSRRIEIFQTSSVALGFAHLGVSKSRD